MAALALLTFAIRNGEKGAERRTLPVEPCALTQQYTHARWQREIPVSVHNKEDIDPEMPRQEGKQRPALMRHFLLLFESIQM